MALLLSSKKKYKQWEVNMTIWLMHLIVIDYHHTVPMSLFFRATSSSGNFSVINLRKTL